MSNQLAGSQLKWKEPVIRDGFTQQGYIAEKQGLYGALKFSYRPLLPESTDNYEAHRATKKGADDTKLVAGIVAEQLVSWQAGEGIDPTLDNVRRLRYGLLYKLYNIIAGFEPTDLDPDWQEDAEGGKLPPLPQSLMEQIKN